MYKRPVLCLAVLLLLIGGLRGQDEKRAKKVLKNADVVLMTQNHFDDDTLVKIIDVSETDFDVSTDALVELMKQGVSSNVCRAMLAASRKKRNTVQAPNSEPTPASTTAISASPSTAEAATPASTEPDPTFAARTSNTSANQNSMLVAVTAPSSANPASAASPAPVRPAVNPGMYSPGAMGINPQQMAALQAQMASMGMGGLMSGFGGMGVGGMGSFSMNYSPEQ